MFVFKALHGLAPLYLCELLTAHTPNRALRSASPHLLDVPRTKRKQWGDRSFSVAGPRLWNSLPLELGSVTTLSLFKAKAKDSFVHDCLQLMTLFFKNCLLFCI
ncbi:hypothetical protein NQD34_013977 [Periophthalmus magnuspinnatus]|nr:hypothetical protein NQD34_013977 [Periophthalmus magnuspinnatus]